MRRVIRTRFVTIALSSVVLLLSGAACSTTPTNMNTNTNVNTRNTTAATPSPTATPTSGMSNMNGGMGGMNMQSSPNAASQPFDLQLIDTMIVHHQSALDMARPATTKAQHAELRLFAGKIVEDQQREIAELRRLREQRFAGRPEAVNMEMAGMKGSMQDMDMNKLNTLTGNEFDLAFLDMMTPHHAGATAMAREALQRAELPEVKRIAQNIIGAQEKEIAQMNKWKASWGGARGSAAASNMNG